MTMEEGEEVRSCAGWARGENIQQGRRKEKRNKREGRIRKGREGKGMRNCSRLTEKSYRREMEWDTGAGREKLKVTEGEESKRRTKKENRGEPMERNRLLREDIYGESV